MTRNTGKSPVHPRVSEVRTGGSHAPLLEQIFSACDFKNFLTQPKATIRVLDAMCGPDPVGLALKKKLRAVFPDDVGRTTFYFNDVNRYVSHLLPIDGSFTFILPCDIRKLHERSSVPFHIVVVRYGLTDLQKGGAEAALNSIRRSMTSGGRLVVADLSASAVRQQQSILAIRPEKNVIEGELPKNPGLCYLPTPEEWALLVSAAGFSDILISSTGITVNDVQSSLKFPVLVIAGNKR
jgi:hypothetical protein